MTPTSFKVDSEKTSQQWDPSEVLNQDWSELEADLVQLSKVLIQLVGMSRSIIAFIQEREVLESEQELQV